MDKVEEIFYKIAGVQPPKPTTPKPTTPSTSTTAPKSITPPRPITPPKPTMPSTVNTNTAAPTAQPGVGTTANIGQAQPSYSQYTNLQKSYQNAYSQTVPSTQVSTGAPNFNQLSMPAGYQSVPVPTPAFTEEQWNAMSPREQQYFMSEVQKGQTQLQEQQRQAQEYREASRPHASISAPGQTYDEYGRPLPKQLSVDDVNKSELTQKIQSARQPVKGMLNAGKVTNGPLVQELQKEQGFATNASDKANKVLKPLKKLDTMASYAEKMSFAKDCYDYAVKAGYSDANAALWAAQQAGMQLAEEQAKKWGKKALEYAVPYYGEYQMAKDTYDTFSALGEAVAPITTVPLAETTVKGYYQGREDMKNLKAQGVPTFNAYGSLYGSPFF